MENNFEAISKAVESGDDKKVIELIEEALKNESPAMDILEKGLVPGVQALGKLFKDGQAFLPEILISTRAMNRGVEKLKPYLGDQDIHKMGVVVLGTVAGDMHDIGKNLVRMMLDCSGFKVIDLGVDVSSEAFVNAAREHNADIVAMSLLLTQTMPNMEKTAKSVKKANPKIKIMIGGAPTSREFANSIGAEGWGEDCTAAPEEATRLMALK